MRIKELGVLGITLLLLFLNSTASAGPVSRLYLTGNTDIFVVQGAAVITSWDMTQNGGQRESALAVMDTVRTLGAQSPAYPYGAEYTLNGVPTGQVYSHVLMVNLADGATDGRHNYAIGYNDSIVHQFETDWTNRTTLFDTGTEHYSEAGITYDASNNSLWISAANNSTLIRNYALNGTLLSSFDTGRHNGGLALDPTDGTLWVISFDSSDPIGTLYNYNKTGTLLGSAYYNIGNLNGAEFALNVTPVPEPATMLLLGSGLIGLAGYGRKKLFKK